MTEAEPPLSMKAWVALLRAHSRLVPGVSRELEAACGIPLTWFDVLFQLSVTSEGRLRVTAATEELRQPNVNRSALEQLAAISQGMLVELPELASIEEKLKGDSKFTELHREASVWDNWLTLALLVSLYTLDVGLRRLMGLS